MMVTVTLKSTEPQLTLSSKQQCGYFCRGRVMDPEGMISFTWHRQAVGAADP